MTEPHAWTRADAAAHIRVPTDADDKYSRGVVGLRTGTPAYPGAAVLGVEGAWRAGAGMVRWVGDPDVGRLVLARRPETVLSPGRVGAWVIGSGTDAKSRSAEEEAALRDLLAGDVPVIVDARALDLATGAAAPLILTPHAGEFARLRVRLGLDERATDADGAVAETAAALGQIVLRKGARTLIGTPDGRLIEVSAATPWLATAGAGDVLAGALGALVAQAGEHSELAAVAATAAWLHGRAARIAAHADSGAGRPIVALDVAHALPEAVGQAIDAA